jgi:cytochrome c oxidase assembly protein subunit 15
MGALIATLTLSLAALTVLSRRVLAKFVLPAYLVLAALALQLTIGISMVLRGFPLLLATAHTAGAALLLLSVLALLRSVGATARSGPF